jgi:hypothetical protein
MDLINKKYVTVPQVSQQRCQVAHPFQHRAAGRPYIDAHFIGDDMR